MQLIRSIDSRDLPVNGCALTIGNFDAIHLGHRKILQTLVAQASKRGLTAVVMTFDPHPQEYFQAGTATARLTTTSMRFFALRECGLDIMLSLKFNKALAQTNAEQFVRYHLVARLRTKYLLIGDDFRFGAKRVGDFQLLTQMAPECGYQLDRIDTIQQDARRISSSWVRDLLKAGQLTQAEQLLGRKYTYTGRVIFGEQRGAKWGVPTINLAVRHQPAVCGVFAVTVSNLTDAATAGVASIGTRPTVDASDNAKTVLEVHLFDYDGDAYGKRVCVEFVQKIRDEEKFSNYAALIKKMKEDIKIAKQILGVPE